MSDSTSSPYAATIAPIIDRVHADIHRRGADAARTAGLPRCPYPGLLITCRFRLLSGPMSFAEAQVANRYAPIGDLEAGLDRLVTAAWIEDDGEVTPTPRTKAYLHAVYDLHAEVTTATWPAHVVEAPAEIATRLLAAARDTGGAAFAAMSPPFERPGDPPALLLFNRLAAFRYHRADAHHTAWSAEGSTASEIGVLESGPLRERIEAETNRLAAPPFDSLTAEEREAFRAALEQLSVDSP